jgi:hypothetical protein
MNFPGKRIFLVSASLVLTVLATSCSEGKAPQCNRLVAVVNKDQTAYKKYEKDLDSFKSSKPSDRNALKGMVDKYKQTVDALVKDLQAINQEVKDVKLADKELITYRDSYAVSASKLNQELSNLGTNVAAIATVDPKAPDGVAKIRTITQDITKTIQAGNVENQKKTKLVGDLNKYCQGS